MNPEVLVISHKYPPSIGGMQRQCFELVQGLKKHGTVHLLVQVGVSKPVFFLTVVKKARKMLRENPSINLVYVNDGLMALILTPLLKYLRIPIVATIHGLDIVFPMPFFQRWVGRNLTRYDGIIAVSEATRAECISRGLSPEKTHMVKNGFEPNPPKLIDEEKIIQMLLERFHLDVRNRQVIVSIGRGVKRKGFSWFIRTVFPRLSSDTVYLIIGPPANVRLINALKFILPGKLFQRLVLFAGLATDEPEIAKAITEFGLHDRVRRISGLSNEEVLDVIRLARISVMPNLSVEGDFEGFGLVALEAASNGTLCVAAGIEGITSAIEHNVNGILLESGNSHEWVRTLDYLLTHPEIVDSKSLEFQKNTLTNSYSWDKMAGEYVRIFKQLVNKPV